MGDRPDRALPKLALVSGGAGFVGHQVVLALHREGVRVRVLDPAPAHPDWPPGVEHVRGDLLDPKVLHEAAKGVEGIFHVAGIWDHRPGGHARMHALNVGGSEVMLALGIPTLCTSSSITCGFGPLHNPGHEDQPSEDPANPIRGTGKVYRQTKLAIEALARDHGALLVNPDYVVGPGDLHGVVTGPLLRASRMPLIPAPRGGKCFVSARDVGIGHVLAWRHGQPGRKYLLGSENLPYLDVLRTLAELQGHRLRTLRLPRRLPGLLSHLPVIGGTAGAIEQMNLARYRSNQRAREELGFAPEPVIGALRAMVAEDRAIRR